MTTIDKARNFLMKQDITKFELDVRKVKFENGKEVIFDTFQNYAKITGTPVVAQREIEDGCTIITRGVHLILVHRGDVARTRWTLAHEVAHVCLGHIRDTATEERQADMFASELLMPELVILELQKRLERELNASEIAALFGVSQSAAQNKQRLMQGKSFFSAYLKDEIMARYERLIKNYVKRNRVSICVTT